VDTTVTVAAMSHCPEDIYWVISIGVAIVFLAPPQKSSLIKINKSSGDENHALNRGITLLNIYAFQPSLFQEIIRTIVCCL